jgi:DNA-binding NarL/FixJ family response regulator
MIICMSYIFRSKVIVQLIVTNATAREWEVKSMTMIRRPRARRSAAIGSRRLNAKMRTKILCIEDDRERATRIAEELVDRGFEVDVARDGHEGFVAMVMGKPDLVLCDISKLTMPGLEVLERLSEVAPRLADVPFVYLAKPADRESLPKGPQLGAEYGTIRPSDFDILVKTIEGRLANVARTKLNDREIDTLTWVARGKTSAEIAQELGLTKRTVDFHINNARMKLGATTRTAAVYKAVAAGLIEP